VKEGIGEVVGIADRRDRFVALLALVEPGDVVVDCGANVGSVASRFAERGCVVHCFEPDPLAFAQLQKRLVGAKNIHLYPKAVWKEAGCATLYFHHDRAEDALEVTQASSLMQDKINVEVERGLEVELVDLPGFLRSLDGPAAILKMDVEGAEGELLKAILEQRLEDRFRIALVETHERKVPSSREPMRYVRQAIADRGLKHIFLDWK
jgi:FkbM family methyltransferase